MATKKEIKKVADSVHQYLYGHVKLSDTEKTSLIAGIFIALENNTFKNTYAAIEGEAELKQAFFNAINNAIDAYDGLKNGKTEVKASFDGLRGHKTLFSFAQEPQPLQNIIKLIEGPVYEVAKEEPELDALHVFYNEFTRRSGADQQTLGIVLTPPHMADFMADLLEITEKDVLLDTCIGTAGLLMKADRKTGTQNDSVGIELNSKMLAFGVANMMIRGGKTALYNGSALDPKITSQAKEHKPTKMIINPPYAQPDAPELEFIEKGLDMLAEGGLGAAIVPMSCGMKNDTKSKALRASIMSKHTLKASFTMPADLFMPVAVNTMIMLFEAGTPHSATSETFFGELADDGFITIPHHGRVDDNNEWKNVRERLLEAKENHESIPGVSKIAVCGATDEWVTEAYIDTDYGVLTDEVFEENMKAMVIHSLKEMEA